ncbi:MAG: hypothetical protein ABIB43_05770 [archaeon]
MNIKKLAQIGLLPLHIHGSTDNNPGSSYVPKVHESRLAKILGIEPSNDYGDRTIMLPNDIMFKPVFTHEPLKRETEEQTKQYDNHRTLDKLV